MTKAVTTILTMIEQLGSKDRRAIEDKLLDDRLEREWRKEVAKARRKAKREGITDEVIDRAVMEIRYGK